MATLLRFLGIFITYLAKLCNNPVLSHLSLALPKTLYSARKYLKSSKRCVEYVVCPKCSTLYLLEACIITQNRTRISKLCDHIEFPNHPHSSRRSKCNATLLKSVRIGNKSKLVPRKVYAYHGIIRSLKEMAKRPGFLDMCEHWRDRETAQPGVLGDI